MKDQRGKTATVKQDDRRSWEEKTLNPALERRPERTTRFTTVSDLPIERLYSPEDLDGWNPEEKLGFPGEPPFTRGVYPSMHRGRLWTMRQFAGFGSAEDTNQRFRYLLDHGQGGLSTAFDLPTLMGKDSDDPLAEGEVGREAWRSTRSPTWKCCSTPSRSTRSRLR